MAVRLKFVHIFDGNRKIRLGAARSFIALLVSIGLLLGGIFLPTIAASAVPGAPFDPNIPRTFVSQSLPSGTQMQLYDVASNTIGGYDFVPVGDPQDVGYNALGFEPTDNFLYAIAYNRPGVSNVSFPAGSLVRIDQDGIATRVGSGAPDAALAYPIMNAGGFTDDGDYWVGSGRDYPGFPSKLFRVDTTTGAIVQTVPLAQNLKGLISLTWKDGYFWGLGADTGIVPATKRQEITRIGLDGTVTQWNLGDAVLPGSYGAGWTFGNGNLGFSENLSGTVYQISVENPSASAPTFTVVGQYTGPSTWNNDGASIKGKPVDLALTKTGPASYIAGGTITYTMKVHNNGPGKSSGWVLNDPIPDGLSVISMDSPNTQCQVVSNEIRCLGSNLDFQEENVVTVVMAVAAGRTGTITNTATIIGNELDLNTSNLTSTTTSHPRIFVPGLNVAKSSLPASGNSVARNGIVNYTVLAENTGDAPLTGVSIKDDLSHVLDHADIVAGSLSASDTNGLPLATAPSVTGTELSWTGDLAVDAKVTLTYDVRVKTNFAGAATLKNAVTGSGTAPGSAPVASNCVLGTEALCFTEHDVSPTSLTITKTDGVDVVGAGETLTYNVSVTNTGADVASGVIAVDTLPVGLTFQSATDAGIYNPVARTVTWNLGSLGLSERKGVSVKVKVDQGVIAGQSIRNQANVDSDQGCVDNPVSPDDECNSTDEDEVVSLSITKDDSKTLVAPGELVTYDVTITNNGSRAVDSVVASDELPQNLEFDSATASGVFDPATRLVGWQLGTLTSGQSVTVQVAATVADTVSPNDEIRNVAVVDSPHGCVDNRVTPSNECRAIDIDEIPAVSITKTNSKNVVIPGESSTYELTAKNSGTSHAPQTVITDTVPANLTFVSASDNGVHDPSTGVVTWAVGDLAPGAEKVVSITATVAATAVPNEAITNTAQVATEGRCVDDPSTTVNECKSTDIDRIPAVSLVKDDGKTIVKPGENTIYTITATNASEYSATDVVVRDALPANLEFVESSVPATKLAGSTNTYEWHLGDLAGLESKVITVTTRVAQGVAADTPIVNSASIRTDDFCLDNPATAANECLSADEASTPSGVWILKDDRRTTVLPGESLTYNLTVGTNLASAAVTDAVVSDVLPASLTFESATKGGSYDPATRTVKWTFPSIAAGSKIDLQVRATVSQNAVPGEKITNRATIAIPGGCSTDEACSSTDEDTVPNVSISKDDHQTFVSPGNKLTYDLTVRNKSGLAAKGVVVSDSLPSELTFVSATDGADYDARNNRVSWDLGTLGAGVTRVIKVTAKVNSDPAGELVNTATVTTEHGCIGNECSSQDVDQLTGGLALTGSSAYNASTILLAVLAALTGWAIVLRRRKREYC